MAAERPEFDLDDFIRRYQAGESLKQLSNALGISRTALHGKLTKAGIKIRGRSEAEKLKWSRMAPEEIRERCSAAWAACRGRKIPMEVLLKQAATRHKRVRQVHRGEREVADTLRRLGFTVEPQMAVGCYNLDVALPVERVAVEIIGHRWIAPSGTVEKVFKRTKHILDSGWSILFVFIWHRESSYERFGHKHAVQVRPFFCPARVAEQVHSFCELVRWNEAAGGKYGVISGNGQVIACRTKHLDNLPFVREFVAD